MAVPVVENLEDIPSLGWSERIAEPVVEDQKVDAAQGVEELGIRAVGVGERRSVKQTAQTLVPDTWEI